MSIRTPAQTSPSIGLASCKNSVSVFLHPSQADTVELTQPSIFLALPPENGGSRMTMNQYSESSLYTLDSDHSNTVSDFQIPTPAPSTSEDRRPPINELEPCSTCVVCGEDGAKMHYGVLACLGCKGFFRRALKKADQYECINDNRCVINRYGRNSCRACRLGKCLEAGMDPAAVRPDRDNIGRQTVRLPQVKKNRNPPPENAPKPAENQANTSRSSLLNNQQDEMIKKLPVEMRTMLMNLLNMEIKISRGDTLKDAKELYPLHIHTIKEVIENPIKLKGKRTEMRYEPYRMAKNEELSMIVYRRLIAAIDWVDLLSEMVDGLSTDDRIALVKSCYAPLLLFKCSARTAMVTEQENILCLCNFAYVPRNIAQAYSDTYHLDNGLVDRLINELVLPFRKLHLTEEELVCLSAIIVFNPMAKDLSEHGIKKVSSLRDKIQDTLFQFIKETRPGTKATSNFGNLLLYLPILASLANVLCENLRFAQTFSTLGSFPLLTSLFGCFPVEPFLDSEMEPERREIIRKNVEVQTDVAAIQQRGIKRRLPNSFVSPVENESSSELREFRLLRPPCSYTLTEMFEDRMNKDPPFDNSNLQMNPQLTWPPRQQPQPSTSYVRQTFVPPQMHNGCPVQNTQNGKQPVFFCRSIPHQNISTSDNQQQDIIQDYSHSVNLGNPSQNSTNAAYSYYPASGVYYTPPIEKLSFQHRENN